MSDLLPLTQPYPDLNPWEDISSIVTNGWGVDSSSTYLLARVAENTTYLKGRLTVGDSERIGLLPTRLWPSRPINEPGGWLRTPKAMCEVDIWGNGNLVLPLASLPAGVSLGSLAGTFFAFAISYPRRAA